LRLVAGTLLDADRFHSDVAGEELALRQQKYHREQQIYDNKRLLHAEKEESRWKRFEESKAAEEAYWVEQRDLGIKVFTLNNDVFTFVVVCIQFEIYALVCSSSIRCPSFTTTGRRKRMHRVFRITR
jgi:hypothetical protein